MSHPKTKTKTTSSGTQNTQLTYDQTQGYPGYLQSTAFLRDLISKPFEDPQYLLAQGAASDQAIRLGQRYMSTLMHNLGATGFTSQFMPGFMQAMTAQGNRNTSHMQAFNANALRMTQLNQRVGAAQILQHPLPTGAAMQYTGQGTSTTQQTQPLGGLLGPLLGAGLSLIPGAGALGSLSSLGSVPMTMGGGPFGGQVSSGLTMAGVGAGPYNTNYWNSYVPGFNTSNSTMQGSPYTNSPYPPNPFTQMLQPRVY